MYIYINRGIVLEMIENCISYSTEKKLITFFVQFLSKQQQGNTLLVNKEVSLFSSC